MFRGLQEKGEVTKDWLQCLKVPPWGQHFATARVCWFYWFLIIFHAKLLAGFGIFWVDFDFLFHRRKDQHTTLSIKHHSRGKVI